ncbi:MAG TPA: type IV toxin-antitoxin system AbiEi family antitoxin domain-containing protein [Acidimicrobiia bacterium]|jgi:very-short-patch-repair endonuclease
MRASLACILRLAEEQHGVIARRQAVAAGLSETEIDSRVRLDRWDEVLRGVYRVPGAPRSDSMARMAATLRVDGSALYQLTAAATLHLDLRRSQSIDVAVARTASGRTAILGLDTAERTHWNVAVHRPQRLDAIDHMTVDGIPCTTAARTLIDVAFSVNAESLEHAFDTARRFRLVSTAHLERRAGALCGRGKRGSRAIYALLSAHARDDAPTESKLEVRFARLLRTTAIELPQRQFSLRLPNGRRARLDFADATLKVAVECEGYEFHGSRAQWKHDRRRIALLEGMGWRIVTVTWDDVTLMPELTLQRVADALAERRRAHTSRCI